MEFKLPQLGEGVYEAELIRWLVQLGAAVKRGQGLMEVMTDKATMEVPAPFAGTVTALHATPGTSVKVGDLVMTYEPAGSPAPAPAAAVPAAAPKAARSSNGREDGHPVVARAGRLPLPAAAPSVRHLARKLGLDLARIRGSGPAGRILIDDLTAAMQARQSRPSDAPAKPAAPQLDIGVAGIRVKFQGMRRKIAEHMVRSAQTIPHYTYVDECEVTDLVVLRQSLREPLASRGVKLTYLAFFVKAAVLALKEVPIVNASLDETAGEIVLHDHYHIGIAVAAPAGLLVPVVRDADRKDLPSIAEEIERLSADARAGKSRREDLRDGTFTVTSIGNLGGLIATPIINHPEVGILGVGKVVRRPVYDEVGQVRPADLVYLSLSFDHRVVDGAVGAAFGNALIRALRNPAAMLLPERFRA